MKKVELTRNKYALVSDKDFPEINRYKWFANRFGKLFYAARSTWKNGKRGTVLMHRQILSNNVDKKLEIDHADGNGLNNQRNNLRLATKRENQLNCSKRDKICSSKFKGVSWSPERRKWMAYGHLNGKMINLGRYDDEIIAAKIYNKFTMKYYGKFKRLNIV